MAVLVQHSMRFFARRETTVPTLNSFVSILAQPKLPSSLNLPNLLASTRNAKREDGVSKQPRMNGVEEAE